MASDQQILAYRITRKFESTLLDPEVIKRNMLESDNIHNTQYIMSIGTSWLRAHPNSTLYDLEIEMEKTGIATIIYAAIPRPIDQANFDLCVPANPNIKPKYIAQFIPGMRAEKTTYLSNIHSTTEEENLERLKLAGFTCAKGQIQAVTMAKKPTVSQLKLEPSIHNQLQWALVSVTIERFDPEKTLESEIARCTKKYRRTPYTYQVKIENIPIEFLIMPEEGRINIVSEFGLMYREGKANAIHIKTFVKNMFREHHQITDAEKRANLAITEAASKFDVDKITNADNAEKAQIIHYLEQHMNTSSDFAMGHSITKPPLAKKESKVPTAHKDSKIRINLA